MTKHPEIYYFFDELTRTVFWNLEFVEDRPDLMFLGSSVNPNKRMAVSAFVKGSDQEFGYKIKELPTD